MNEKPELKKMICNNCGKEVYGGVYIGEAFYCTMCGSIINRDRRNIPAKVARKIFFK